MLRRLSFATLLVALAFIATPAMAQTTNGVIAGIASDAQGGVLPGVTVTARNVDTGATRNITTEADGRFRLAGLLPGRYELRAELQGFGTVTVPDITVAVGSETTRNVTMQVQGLQESVTVTGEAPVIEVTKTDISGIVTQDQMQMLPLATRQPMDLALLLPGTNQDAVRARKANSNIGAGAFTNGSALLVDGVWNKEGNTGEPRQDFPQSAIQEFKVFVSQSPAEYGWTAGGAVSMATKSGTNNLHGEAFEFFRNKALNTIDPFAAAAGQAKPDFSRHQYGLAVGGPVIKDRVHFFEAAEGLQNNLYDTVIVRQPQFYGNMNGVFKSPEYNHMSFTRGDAQITQKQSLFVRYAWQISDFTCEGCAASSFTPWFSGSGIKQKRYSWAGAYTWVVSPRILNEVRGQFTNYHFRQHPPGVEPQEDLFDSSPSRAASLTATYAFPSLTWGTSANFYTEQISRELRDDLSITTGTHTWKLGAGAQKLAVHGDNRPSLGTWTFAADQPFNPTNLGSFVPVAGSVRQFATGNLVKLPTYTPNVLTNFYAEDEWKPTAGITLNLGLRYDYQFYAFNQGLTLDSKDKKYGIPLFPTTNTAASLAPLVHFEKRGDKDNIGPRVGFAWDVRNDTKTVVRADYGIYYNPMNLQITSAEVNNFRQPTATIANPTYPDPYGGRDPITFVSTAPQNIQVMADDLENLQSAAYTVGVSQALTSVLAVHVDGVYNHMSKVPMTIDINPRSGGTAGNRPLPQFARVLQAQSVGFMNYKALLVRLEKRLEHNYMYLVSYTLSASNGNVNNSGGTQSVVTDSAHIDYDEGPNNSDRLHTLVASGSFLLPGDVMLGGVFTARSTMPFSAIAGVDINGDGNVTDYVPGTTRNVFNRGNDAEMLALVNAWRAANGMAAISPKFSTNEFYGLDVRASKSIRLNASRRVELIVQVFNALNRKNIVGAWQTNALSSAFGTSVSAFAMRQAEIAARFTF
ncbi:MAG TPA: carboxypeptidase regulatory-like domain-containing protein [Vicinamibacterales bacterium]|jgi:Carboxypeptidase regulatory-like domain|nr:carboxypeptidase regulatory-like domain-containing protein [Vicinamibacterales bacterium]